MNKNSEEFYKIGRLYKYRNRYMIPLTIKIVDGAPQIRGYFTKVRGYAQIAGTVLSGAMSKMYRLIGRLEPNDYNYLRTTSTNGADVNIQRIIDKMDPET